MGAFTYVVCSNLGVPKADGGGGWIHAGVSKEVFLNYQKQKFETEVNSLIVMSRKRCPEDISIINRDPRLKLILDPCLYVSAFG